MASIEIFGDDNYILIDDKYKNLIYVDTFNMTFPQSSNPGVVRGSYLDIRYTSPIQAVPSLAVSSVFPTVMTFFQRDGNSYWWRVACSAAGLGGTAQFYLLHLPQVIVNSGGILQIFNAQGEIVFDSNLEYCKAQATFQTTMAGDRSIALPAGKKYAHVLTIPAYTYSALPASGGSTGLYETNIIYTYCGIYFNAAGAVGTRFTYSQEMVPLRQPPANSGQTNNDSSCLILDVTNVAIQRNA